MLDIGMICRPAQAHKNNSFTKAKANCYKDALMTVENYQFKPLKQLQWSSSKLTVWTMRGARAK